MIGERLMDLRKDSDMTQKQVSEALSLNFRTYSGYERNESEPSDEIKILIARYFNVSLDYLLGLIKNPRPIEDGDDYIRLIKPLNTAAKKELRQFLDYLYSKNETK